MFKSGNVTVMVADMKKAVKFYAETLGLGCSTVTGILRKSRHLD